MKNIFFLSLFLPGGGLFTDHAAFVNPTGTYLLKGEVQDSKIIGHYGELRVRLLDSGTIALSFYVNEGYPNYEFGSLMDTIHYEDNRANYKPANDSACAIYFAFELRSVEIFQVLTDPHSGCGFRPGVIIPAVFAKTSSDVPVIQDLSAHGSFQ